MLPRAHYAYYFQILDLVQGDSLRVAVLGVLTPQELANATHCTRTLSPNQLLTFTSTLCTEADTRKVCNGEENTAPKMESQQVKLHAGGWPEPSKRAHIQSRSP